VLEQLKNDFMELKDALMDLKDNIKKLAMDALDCISKKLMKPFDCYKSSFGAITYTQDERTEWEDKMKERATKKNIEFNPADYPTTDMIVPEPPAKKK